MKKIIIVIPAYNESNNLKKTLEDITGHVQKDIDIIVVDDGSKDNTFEIASSFKSRNKITALKHMINLGKGAALKTGCDYALEDKADYIIVMDADTQHKASDIIKFTEKLKKNDIVVGVRRFNKNMPSILKIGNHAITKSLSILFNIRLEDVLCGFRAFTADAYRKIRWSSADYSVEVEMLANTGKHKLKYDKVFIETIYADKYKGTTVFDGVKIMLSILFFRIRR